MKYLIFFILCMCSDFKEGQLRQKRVESFDQQYTPLIKGEIELLVAFWWPQKMYPGEEKLVQEIIDASQNISMVQNKFMKERKTLNCAFDKLNCLCHLNFICEDGLAPSDEIQEQCFSIQDKIFEVDGSFVIEQDFNLIKQNLLLFKEKGEWINSFLDYSTFDVATIDTESRTFFLPHWENENNNLTPEWISYSGTNLRMKDQDLEFDLNIREGEFILQGSGVIQDKSREGIIYFEIPKKSNKATCDSFQK